MNGINKINMTCLLNFTLNFIAGVSINMTLKLIISFVNRYKLNIKFDKNPEYNNLKRF